MKVVKKLKIVFNHCNFRSGLLGENINIDINIVIYQSWFIQIFTYIMVN